MIETTLTPSGHFARATSTDGVVHTLNWSRDRLDETVCGLNIAGMQPVEDTATTCQTCLVAVLLLTMQATAN